MNEAVQYQINKRKKVFCAQILVISAYCVNFCIITFQKQYTLLKLPQISEAEMHLPSTTIASNQFRNQDPQQRSQRRYTPRPSEELKFWHDIRRTHVIPSTILRAMETNFEISRSCRAIRQPVSYRSLNLVHGTT